MIPERLSHFRILAEIGQGGMGVVYKAEDERLRRMVALKLLAPAFMADEERKRRFVLEAQAAAAVRHPAIAAIYEVGEDQGATFIAMELVEGRTLRAFLETSPPSIPEALRIVTELAHGLERTHASGVIHRDLKPDNVMLEADGRVKILDFGLAKLLEDRGAPATGISQLETRAGALTREGSLVGTPAYMSPEQARGQSLDQRSDLFSLGVILYELLTRRHPFRGPTPLDTLSAILKEQPVPASAINPEVPPAFESILDGLLAKERESRPASAATLIAELDSNFVQSLWAAAFIYGQLGRYDEGIEAAQRAASLSGRAPVFLGTMGLLLARADRRDEAGALLKELEARSAHEYVSPLFRAWIFAGLGEGANALDCLERACEERNSMMLALAAMREFDFLRGEPRFELLLRRMNLSRGATAGP